MRAYHIIEQTTDQQTMEIWAESMVQAIEVYANRALVGEAHTTKQINGNTWRIGADGEYCTITAHNERIAFAKWTHDKGLY